MKIKRKTVDPRYLRQIESCEPGIERFCSVFGKKPVEISAANIRKYADKFPDYWEDDLIYLADNLLDIEVGDVLSDTTSSQLIRKFMAFFREASK